MARETRIFVEMNLPSRACGDAKKIILATADSAHEHGLEMRDLDITDYPVGRYKGRAYRAMEWCFSVPEEKEKAAREIARDTYNVLASECGAM